jgi:hypothetical protein
MRFLNYVEQVIMFSMVMSVTLTLSNQFTMHTFIVIKYVLIVFGNSSVSGKIFSLQKEIVKIMGLRPLACWDCGFESRRGMNVCLL